MASDEAAWLWRINAGMISDMTLRSILLASLAALASAGAASAAAQDIVVQAPQQLDPPKARRFVGQVSRAVDGQLVRLREPVCPAVIGLKDESARAIERRIGELARSVGAKVAADADCQHNLVVMFPANANAFMAEARARRPAWFEGLGRAEVERIAGTGAVRSWALTSLRNDDGQDPPATGFRFGGRSMIVRDASILRRSTLRQVEMSFLLIERIEAEGLTVNQLAAYALMRGLTRTDVPLESPAPTILTLFDPTVAQEETDLTAADRAFLTALYESDPRDDALRVRARIAAKLAGPTP